MKRGEAELEVKLYLENCRIRANLSLAFVNGSRNIAIAASRRQSYQLHFSDSRNAVITMSRRPISCLHFSLSRNGAIATSRHPSSRSPAEQDQQFVAELRKVMDAKGLPKLTVPSPKQLSDRYT